MLSEPRKSFTWRIRRQLVILCQGAQANQTKKDDGLRPHVKGNVKARETEIKWGRRRQLGGLATKQTVEMALHSAQQGASPARDRMLTKDAGVSDAQRSF